MAWDGGGISSTNSTFSSSTSSAIVVPTPPGQGRLGVRGLLTLDVGLTNNAIKRDPVFIKEISKFRRCIDGRLKSSIYKLLLPECWIVHYGRDIFMQPIDNRRRRC